MNLENPQKVGVYEKMASQTGIQIRLSTGFGCDPIICAVVDRAYGQDVHHG